MTPVSGYSTTLSNATKYLQIIFIAALLLYFGKTLFVPLSFGLLIGIMAYPACKWMEGKKWNRGIAITLIISLFVILFGALIWLLGFEVNLFIKDLPVLREKMAGFSSELSDWMGNSLGMTLAAQENLLGSLQSDLKNAVSGLFTNLLATLSSTLVMFFLIPVYAALFLYHRGTFIKFLQSIAGEKLKEKLGTILRQSILTYFKFIKGTFFVYCIVGVLNSLGLLLLGIKHAFLFGMITAFMTAIPYFGIIVSTALPISVALITKDSIWYSAGVILVFTFVQYLEANIIFPRVVGQQLNLSTWAVLVVIVAGTILWGISGMILFIPFASILKILSDNIEEWKPLRILLSRNGTD